ncbi:MAG: TIM barrel protein [Clostridia bacterium]|nr:TIM barrel protein [Clostridia bacterium]
MIKFGPSGNSQRFYSEGYKSTTQAPKWCAEQGLTAYEYSFGRGINISDDKCNEIALEAKKYGVQISVHAPYYINFANPSDEMAEKSYNYVLRSAEKARCFGGKRIIFHPSTVGKMTRADAVALTHKRLEILADLIVENNMDDMIFCPETMGKINQIGNVEEVVSFCKIAPFYIPTIDFGHINARTHGSLATFDDYEKLVLHVIDELGFERASKMHVHFSKIEYSTGGEVRHLTFADQMYGPDFEPLARVFKKYNMQPVIICESDGTQADDAVEMKRIYESVIL